MISLCIGEMCPQRASHGLLVFLSTKSPVLESVHIHVCETDDPAQECPELAAIFWAPGSDSEFLHTRDSTSASS